MNIVTPYARLMDVPDRNAGVVLLRKIEFCGRISHRSEETQSDESWERFLRTLSRWRSNQTICERCANMLMNTYHKYGEAFDQNCPTCKDNLENVHPQAERRNPAAIPQPPPLQGHTDVTSLLIADLEARRVMGIQKYGTPLLVENGRDHCMDAYQEILDHAAYFRCLVAQRENMKRRLHALVATMYALNDPSVEDMADTLIGIMEECLP